MNNIELDSIKKERKKKILEIDALKGFAICFVILGHAIIYYPINLHENMYCQWLFDFVCSVHLPLFFIVSGFCFSYKGGFKNFLSKKIFRIILPYFIFNIFDIIPRVFLPQLVNRSKTILEDVIDIFLYGGEYWFLYVLFIIFVIYVPISTFLNKYKIFQILLELFLFIILFVPIQVELFLIQRVVYYLFFFNTGYLLKKYKDDIFNFNIKSLLLKAVISIFMILIWVISVTYFYNSYTIPFIGIWAIITVFFFTKFKWFSIFFGRFGEYSLQLYLFNGFFLVASRMLICKITFEPVLIICFNMFVDFFISYIFIKYIWSKVRFLRIISGMSSLPTNKFT